MEFILSIWREACQHLELSDSIERIARLVTRELPADAIVVRALDFQQRRLHTPAVGLGRKGADIPRGNTECSAEQFTEVVAWCRRGAVMHSHDDLGKSTMELLAPPADGEWL